MSAAPQVSVIVCTYNRAESLRDTLLALQRQVVTDGLDFEVVVVDNNSADRTPLAVEQCAREGKRPIRYLFEPVQGKTHALNLGIRESRGELLAFTDDDVVPEPGWVEALWNTAERFHADGVSGRILPLWAKRPPSWLEGQHTLLSSLALIDQGSEPIVGSVHTAYRTYGANMAFRKRVCEEIGGFRTDLGPHGAKLWRGDDTDFVIRAFRAGKRIVYAPDAVVHHKVPVERMRLAYLRKWTFQAGRMQALVLPEEFGPGFPRWLLRRCAEEGLRALWAYGRGRIHQGVRHEMAFWEELGELIQVMKAPRANGAPIP